MAGAVFGELGFPLFVAGAAFGDILGDSRSAKCCIFQYKMRLQDGTSKVSEAAGARCDFLIGICSDYPRIVFILAEAIQRVSAAIFKISWQAQYLRWRLTLLAPRIGNEVSCVTRINHGIHFAWQAQHLVRFEVDFACSAHWK